MSKGDDSRTGRGREAAGRADRAGKGTWVGRTSRSSVQMTAARARAIQAGAEIVGTSGDSKSCATPADERSTVSGTDNE